MEDILLTRSGSSILAFVIGSMGLILDISQIVPPREDAKLVILA